MRPTLTEGHRKLRTWLKGSARGQTGLAQRLSTTQSAVALWTKPGHRPGPVHRRAMAILKIAREDDWFTAEEMAQLADLAASIQEAPAMAQAS